jgi:hypothetical protein
MRLSNLRVLGGLVAGLALLASTSTTVTAKSSPYVECLIATEHGCATEYPGDFDAYQTCVATYSYLNCHCLPGDNDPTCPA